MLVSDSKYEVGIYTMSGADGSVGVDEVAGCALIDAKVIEAKEWTEREREAEMDWRWEIQKDMLWVVFITGGCGRIVTGRIDLNY